MINSLFKSCDLFYKIAKTNEAIAILKSNIGNYIHFSNSERFGISYHKNIHPGNPRALYGFPLTRTNYENISNNKNSFYDYMYSKYIYVFSVNGNILDIDNINSKDLLEKVKNLIKKYPNLNYDISKFKTINGIEFIRLINYLSKMLFKNEHSGMNILLRELGYDAIETKKYGFGDDLESEIAVVNPASINLIAKLDNPMLSKEQIKEISWYQSEDYLKQKENENKIKEQKEKDLLKLRIQKLNEEEELYEKERKLLKEHKFDEAKMLRELYNEKWRDLLP